MQTSLTYETWDAGRAADLESHWKSEMDVIKWAYREYGSNILYACSFGAEGMVLLDLITKVDRQAKIVFLDTGLHFTETYRLIDKVKAKYPDFALKLAKPGLTVQKQEELYGAELWKSNPNLCCSLRKIEPLANELSGVDAWISGLRREQSPGRKNINYLNKDEKFKRIKICPLIEWNWEDVWNYIRLNHLPYNELHDRNYPSIGCEKCTLPTGQASNFRSGRWAHSEKTECGLHQA